jgi:mRNA interferase MazF
MADPLWRGAPTDLVPVVPLSSTLAPSLLRPDVPAGNGVDRPSRAICRGVRGVAESRMLRRLGRLDAATMAAIDLALAMVLALGERSDR